METKKKRSFLSPLLLLAVIATVFSLILLPSSATSNTLSLPLPPPPPPPQQPFRHRYCDSFPTKYPPSICKSQFKQFLINFPPPPPQPPSMAEIDPRYGVEKRLVPSGPNPLHN